MLEIFQLIVLFIVLFDPPASMLVFLSGTRHLNVTETRKTAVMAFLLAGLFSFGTLLLGDNLLKIFNTNIDNFRIAGGIILVILGIRMAFGYPLLKTESTENKSARSVAALIATPLLTGPAVISSIIVLRYDYGMFLTGLSVLIVLLFALFLFLFARRLYRILNPVTIQIMTTFLGLITIAWGIGFFRAAVSMTHFL